MVLKDRRFNNIPILPRPFARDRSPASANTEAIERLFQKAGFAISDSRFRRSDRRNSPGFPDPLRNPESQIRPLLEQTLSHLLIDFNPETTDGNFAAALAVQPDKKIVVVGSVVRSGITGDFAIARIDLDDKLDVRGFGDQGVTIVPINQGGLNLAVASDVAIDGNGRIVVVGTASTGARSPDYVAIRLTADGQRDFRFGGTGMAAGLASVSFHAERGFYDDNVHRVLLDGSKIVLVGDVGAPNGGLDVGMARFNEDGSPDSSFGPDGKFTIDHGLGGGSRDTGMAVLPAGNGDLLVVGSAGADTPVDGSYFAATRIKTATASPPLSTLLEGDYDGVADLALYRHDASPATGVFAVRLSNGGSPMATTIEIPDVDANVIPVTGDFDGDGKADAAVVNPNARLNGSAEPNASVWTILLSSSGNFRREVPFGAAGVLDRPAPADFDGDGITDIATFRADSDVTPGAAQWFILPSRPNPRFSTSNGAFTVTFGAAGGVDLPAPFDFDGDGRADIATFRPVSDIVPGAAQWFIPPSGPNDPTFSGRIGGFPVTFGAGGNADQPVVADYNGDGRDDITAFRSVTDQPRGDRWFTLPSSSSFPDFGVAFPVIFGADGDIAAVSDYDGDGRPDLAVFSPNSGDWTIRETTTGVDRSVAYNPFGASSGVVPVVAPLFFRLRATDNLLTSAASAALHLVVDSAVADLMLDRDGDA